MADKEQTSAAESSGPNDNPMNLHGKPAEEKDESQEDGEPA